MGDVTQHYYDYCRNCIFPWMSHIVRYDQYLRGEKPFWNYMRFPWMNWGISDKNNKSNPIGINTNNDYPVHNKGYMILLRTASLSCSLWLSLYMMLQIWAVLECFNCCGWNNVWWNSYKLLQTMYDGTATSYYKQCMMEQLQVTTNNVWWKFYCISVNRKKEHL